MSSLENQHLPKQFISHKGSRVDYIVEDVVYFPSGLPGFRELRNFVIYCPNGIEPLAYLQSVVEPYTRFLILPAKVIDADYRPSIEAVDREILFAQSEGLDLDELSIYFVLSIDKRGTATVNMLAPVLIRPSTGRGVQAVRSDSVYSHARALVLEKVEVL